MLVNRIITVKDHPQLYGISVYFQGCDANPKCAGCHNPETWGFDKSKYYNVHEAIRLIEKKIDMLLSVYDKAALVFLGGEPLAKPHRHDVLLISKYFKEKYGDRVTTVLFTWRLPKHIVQENLQHFVEHIDEFVMGRYLKRYHVGGFPASKNQLYLNKEEFKRALSKAGRVCYED